MSTLMEETKLVVLVKYEVEYREKLKLEGILWNFRTITIVMQARKTKIFYLSSSLQVPRFRLRLSWLRIKSLKIERYEDNYKFLDYLDCHESAAWIKTKTLLFESSSANKTFSMETSREK